MIGMPQIIISNHPARIPLAPLMAITVLCVVDIGGVHILRSKLRIGTGPAQINTMKALVSVARSRLRLLNPGESIPLVKAQSFGAALRIDGRARQQVRGFGGGDV